MMATCGKNVKNLLHSLTQRATQSPLTPRPFQTLTKATHALCNLTQPSCALCKPLRPFSTPFSALCKPLRPISTHSSALCKPLRPFSTPSSALCKPLRPIPTHSSALCKPLRPFSTHSSALCKPLRPFCSLSGGREGGKGSVRTVGVCGSVVKGEGGALLTLPSAAPSAGVASSPSSPSSPSPSCPFSTTSSTMAPTTTLDPMVVVDKYIAENKVIIFSKSFCPFCHKVKNLFNSLNVPYEVLELDLVENGSSLQAALKERSGQNTVPNVYINGTHVGGADDTLAAHSRGDLMKLVNKGTHTFDYDLVVIGGGSGGLAASKQAADLGAKVAVCDFVTPTPLGTTWGLGGTCVNVGCIPKKLMHQAALLKEGMKDSRDFGWDTPEDIGHNWNKMVEGIQNHIGSLNWGYRVALRDKKVDYLNAFATFQDPHTLKTVDRRGKEKTVTSDKVLLATGGRPRYPDIPGAKELCITSDDIFSLPHAPGKTLLVGASYISLECAGFLAGLGFDVTVMVRSILLRGFDQQMAEKIGAYMEGHGVKFIRGAVPTAITRVEEGSPGTLQVMARTTEGEEIQGQYNTVVVAIGRDPCTASIGLDKLDVKLAKSGKVVVDEKEQSSVPHVYAVGDIVEGGLELTPVAIQAGKLLAQRLYGHGTQLTDYDKVPTTVFTPLEYGCCGLSEEEAVQRYGAEQIEVFHSNYQPLEFTVPHRPENDCYAKLVCLKSENNRVLGLHVLGPNAGEITQGFAIGLKLNATKADFDNLIGIHPTTAEIFTTMSVTKASGEDVAAQGC